MKVHFAYNREKDIENFIKGTKSVNSKAPSKFTELFIKEQGEDFEPAKIDAFIQKYVSDKGINLDEAVLALGLKWQMIEDTFVKKAESIFNMKYPHDSITGYLTTNGRCTYSVVNNYFFVYVYAENTNAIVMHELLHFYTWHKYHDVLIAKGLSEQNFNDIKEALTELLNIEFKSELGDYEDKGYVQHRVLRQEIKRLWLEHKNLDTVIENISGTFV